MIRRGGDNGRVWTVAELLRWTTEYFVELGSSSARLEAEILLAKALKKQRIELYTGFNMLVEPEERAAFRSFVERRARREPVAYITGRREFYSLDFEVTPDVLVPRPETEHVVEAVLKQLSPEGQAPRARRNSSSSEPLGSGSSQLPAGGANAGVARVLDLGTGSGCIAIAIAFNTQNVRFDAVDISQEALQVAERNASAHGVRDRGRFFCGDLFSALPEPRELYRVIVSNPPYVSESEHAALMDDVRRYEPKRALVDTKSSSSDGLGFYRAMAAEVPSWLEPNGLLAVEVGAGQSSSVRSIFESAGLGVTAIIRDFAGIERVVTAVRP